jgi:UDP-N-acetylmuramate dehydrogenase
VSATKQEPSASGASTPSARLADWTTFRLGGPSRRMIFCADAGALAEAVRALHAADEPFLLIGGGSNLLVADGGLDRVVVRFADGRMPPRREGDEIEADAAFGLDALAAWCAEEGLAGLGFCAGIPGTVGGAVAGNAGAFGTSLADRLVWVEGLDRHGAVSRREAAALGFGYRRCAAAASGWIVTRARFRLQPGDRGELAQKRSEALAFRRARHPDWRGTPCAGSFFRNVAPTSAAGRRQAAGWFLDRAGVRGWREGGARVFERHANIIVADGDGASASDVLCLAGRMAAAVRRRFNLALDPEVRILGFPEAANLFRGT